MAASTISMLQNQWRNPHDVSSILLVVGGDVVQKAFSQGAGTMFTPVCFSFGCVAYALMALVGILGDGRLLSPPDYPCKVINLNSGYARDSHNFVLSRLLRDVEASKFRHDGKDTDDYGIRISIFEALNNRNAANEFSMNFIHLVAFIVTLLQIGIAFVPYSLNQSWNLVLITIVGILLVQMTGSIPQWTAEKLPNKQRSEKVFAITTGNGSREVIVIFGCGKCLDLEILAAPQMPHTSRLWEKSPRLSSPQPDDDGNSNPVDKHEKRRKAKIFPVIPFRGIPLGFAITKSCCVCFSILWLLLLVNVSAETEFPEGWCYIGVGALGMFQNAWLAAKEMTPEMRNVPMYSIGELKEKNVMDGIMKFHKKYGFLGRPLLREFFPGKLRPREEAWWAEEGKEPEAVLKETGHGPEAVDSADSTESRSIKKKSDLLDQELRCEETSADQTFAFARGARQVDLERGVSGSRPTSPITRVNMMRAGNVQNPSSNSPIWRL